MWRSFRSPLVGVLLAGAAIAPAAMCWSYARAEDAAALFREGQEAYSNGDQQTAYEKYKAAWELKRSYDIAGNLGNVEVKLKKYKEAVPHLEFVLANLPVSMDSETRTAVMTRTQNLLNEAKSHVSIVKFSITPPEASISVDGVPVEGGRVILDPGSHTLTLTAAGYQPTEQTLEVDAGAVENTVITMARIGEGGGGAGGGGGDDVSSADDGPSVPILIAGGVLGLGAIGAGIGLHVVAAGKGGERQDLTDALPGDGYCADNPEDRDCIAIDDLAGQESTFSAAGTGLLIGGGVVVAATLTYWLWPRGGDDDASSEAELQLIPTVGPTMSGLTVMGTF